MQRLNIAQMHSVLYAPCHRAICGIAMAARRAPSRRRMKFVPYGNLPFVQLIRGNSSGVAGSYH
jgi:hypothetical protein